MLIQWQQKWLKQLMGSKKIFISHVALLVIFSCLFVQADLNPPKVRSKCSPCKYSRFAVVIYLPVAPASHLSPEAAVWGTGCFWGKQRILSVLCNGLIYICNSFCWKCCFQNSNQGGITCSSGVCAIWPTRALSLHGAFQPNMTRACHGQSSLLCLCSQYLLNILWNTDCLF